MSSARETALKALLRWERDGAYSGILLGNILSESSLPPSDKALVTRLVLGVIGNLLYIDSRISACSSIKLSKMSPAVRMIIRLSVYQFFFLDRVPDRAACDEGVKLAHRYAAKSAGFVNGVLRGILRQKNKDLLPDRNNDPAGWLSLKYSFPVWMIELFMASYNLEETQSLLEALNRSNPLALRVNTLKLSVEEFISELNRAGFEPQPGRWSRDSVLLDDVGAVHNLPGFTEGYFWVQDEAAQLCAQALRAKPRETVIDVCSAPGGKSFGLACDMQNAGVIHSLDIHQHKMGLIEDSAKRLGIDCIKTGLHDATKPLPELLGKADRVLCDVPCSGLGVIAKKPDIKWQKPQALLTLLPLQKSILQASSGYLKRGGELLYSTCTLNPDENQNVVETFLAENLDFEGVSLADRLPFLGLSEGTWFTTLLPHLHNTDGFFMALIRRKTQ